MSNDTTYTIRIEIATERAEALEQFLNEALPEDAPYERKTVMTYEHMRNLGVIASARGGDRKSVEEILQEAAAQFPGASIEMNWEDEYGQEGSDAFYENPDSYDDSGSEKESPDHIDLGVAERFLENPDQIDLNGAGTIDDDAAEVLAKHEGHLGLNGLTKLSDAAVQSLAGHQGDLNLNGLTELSDATAKALAGHQGELSLNGLTDLSDAVAKALAGNQGGLSLSGLTYLSDAAAESLSKHKSELWLEGLMEIPSPSLAATLAQHSEDLWLENLKNLAPEIAAELARQKCKSEGFFPCLRLDGLSDLSHETALALIGHSGHLFLGLTSISESMARVLADFRGESLGLNYVSYLSDEVAVILSKSEAKEICLEGLTELSDEAYDALSAHEGLVWNL